MSSLIEWIKSHKLTSLLTLLVVLLAAKELGIQLPQPGAYLGAKSGYGGGVLGMPAILPQGAPAMDVKTPESNQASGRMYVRDSSISLLVTDVRGAAKEVEDYAVGAGGFLVSSSITRPEEAPYAEVTVRVPSDQLAAAIEHYRSLGTKVVSENTTGRDITQEYQDLDARLDTLNKTKARLEQIFDKATSTQDLLETQQQILNVQSQIDAYTGQKKYLEDSAQTSRITVYLSTDELALPYAPAGTFNIREVFKEAFRSLIKTTSQILSTLIWVLVYSILGIPVAGVGYAGYKLYKRRTENGGKKRRSE